MTEHATNTTSEPTNREAGSSLPSRPPVAWPILGALALVKLALHLVTAWIVHQPGGFGIFRDELYYLACADHLAWGYVDHPPLSIALLALQRAVFGDSLFALRLLPALAGAATVLVTGLLARELGGGRWAQALAATGALASLVFLAFSSIYSMNAFDVLLMALAAYWLARLIRTERPGFWLLLGLTLGLGLLNKVGVLWIGLGVFVGVVLTRERRWLATRWPWLGGALAALLGLPYLLWNAAHDWAHLEFIERAVTGKYSGLDAWSFVSEQALIHNPTTLPLWLGGLVFLLGHPAGRRFRALGLVWVTAFVVLLANGHSKADYLASAYPILFAAGGVAWERWLDRPRLARLRPVALAVVAAGLVLAPMVVPILPVEATIAYSRALGLQPSTAEGHELAELGQFHADMFGWPEKAEAVAEVYHRLTPEEQARTAIFASNYGRAGAIDHFGPRHGLPGAISDHNNYWLWGPGDATGELVIVLGGERRELEEQFESVEVAGVAECDYCIPYERDLPIHLCRGLKAPLGEVWGRMKHYD